MLDLFDMNLSLELFGLLAGAITSFGFIPQLVKGFRSKKLDDVSYFMPAVLSTGMILWFIYGFFVQSFAIMIANAFSTSCCLILIIMKKRYAKSI